MIRVDNTIILSTRKGDTDMIERVLHYRASDAARVAMLQAQVEAMGRNAAALRRALEDVTAELTAANERGRMMADTIRDLTATNEHLRGGMAGLLGLRVDGPALARTLVDSVPCYDERLYDTGEQWG